MVYIIYLDILAAPRCYVDAQRLGRIKENKIGWGKKRDAVKNIIQHNEKKFLVLTKKNTRCTGSAITQPKLESNV